MRQGRGADRVEWRQSHERDVLTFCEMKAFYGPVGSIRIMAYLNAYTGLCESSGARIRLKRLSA